MSGKAQLEGSVLEQTLALLETIDEACVNEGITHSLDGGTALGVVREGRLLPWDSDVDLALDAEDLPKLRRVAWRMFFKGYRVRFRRATADIGPFKKGDVRLVKIWRRRFGFIKGFALVDLFLRKTDGDKAYWLLGRNRLVLNSMPKKFHTDLTPIEFNGRQYNVPADTDEFLTFRYGDWKTPVKEWNAFDNDGAIVEDRTLRD